MSKTHYGWIGVDLDGTLAHYDEWIGIHHIGQPIVKMCDRVRNWISDGKDVRIFTARMAPQADGRSLDETKAYIEKWSLLVFGKILPITCTKDHGMVELWDDRCVQIIANTGVRADGKL